VTAGRSPGTATAQAPLSGEPVQEYLDKLLLTLTGSPRYIRCTLAEVEAHLQDAVAEGLAGGLSEAQAQAEAVRRIGPPSAVTGHTAQFAQPTAALLRRAVLAGTLIGGVGLVALGVAGAISWALASLAGGTFVTAPFPPGSYTEADCARWLAGDPGTRSCVAAMTADHIGDIVMYGCAAGVLGLLALVAFGVLQSRWQDHGGRHGPGWPGHGRRPRHGAEPCRRHPRHRRRPAVQPGGGRRRGGSLLRRPVLAGGEAAALNRAARPGYVRAALSGETRRGHRPAGPAGGW